MDPISGFFSWLGNISVPKATNLLTDSAATKLAAINTPLSKSISTITGTVPPKATTTEMVSGYLTQGVSFLNSLTGIVSAIQPKQTQVTAPTETLKITTTTPGVTTTAPQQVNLPDNVIVVPGQVSTQGAQVATQAQDFSWVMWLIIALLVLGGLYIVTKGK